MPWCAVKSTLDLTLNHRLALDSQTNSGSNSDLNSNFGTWLSASLMNCNELMNFSHCSAALKESTWKHSLHEGKGSEVIGFYQKFSLFDPNFCREIHCYTQNAWKVDPPDHPTSVRGSNSPPCLFLSPVPGLHTHTLTHGCNVLPLPASVFHLDLRSICLVFGLLASIIIP